MISKRPNKFSGSNVLYTIHYDGAILKYRAKSIFRLVIRVMGGNNYFEVPANNVLNYTTKSLCPYVQRVNLSVYQYGLKKSDDINSTSRSFLLLGWRSDGLFSNLKSLFQINIAESLKGKNIALLGIPMNSIDRYYASCLLKDVPKVESKEISNYTLGLVNK